jgi:competence protein ComEA
MQGGSGVLRVLAVLAAIILGFSGYKLYARGSALQGDLVITGRTPPGINPPVDKPQPQVMPSLPEKPAVNPPAEPSEVVVHVAGAVRKPGLYHLPVNARADDALKAAGGAKPDANLDAINLASRLEDGKQLYVPTRTEAPTGGSPEQTASAKPAAGGAHSSGSSGHSAKLTSPSQGTVNINRASEEELQRLPGVGPSYAARIVQFRKDNGPFASPEQLMDVSGIGEKKFEAMRPFVRTK